MSTEVNDVDFVGETGSGGGCPCDKLDEFTETVNGPMDADSSGCSADTFEDDDGFDGSCSLVVWFAEDSYKKT